MTFLVHFVGPAMEARDIQAGESPYERWEREVEAASEAEAREIGQRIADEVGEGVEVSDVEPTF